MENFVKLSLILNSGKVTKLSIEQEDFDKLTKTFIEGGWDREAVKVTKRNLKDGSESDCYINIGDISIIDLD